MESRLFMSHSYITQEIFEMHFLVTVQCTVASTFTVNTWLLILSGVSRLLGPWCRWPRLEVCGLLPWKVNFFPQCRDNLCLFMKCWWCNNNNVQSCTTTFKTGNISVYCVTTNSQLRYHLAICYCVSYIARLYRYPVLQCYLDTPSKYADDTN